MPRVLRRQGRRKMSLGDSCLVDSHAPHHEQLDVSVYVILIEISVILVDVDVFNAGVECDEDEREGDEFSSGFLKTVPFGTLYPRRTLDFN